MAARVSLSRPLVISICFIFPMSQESKVLEKSTNNIFASRFLASTPLRIRRIVRMFDVIDQFFRFSESHFGSSSVSSQF